MRFGHIGRPMPRTERRGTAQFGARAGERPGADATFPARDAGRVPVKEESSAASELLEQSWNFDGHTTDGRMAWYADESGDIMTSGDDTSSTSEDGEIGWDMDLGTALGEVGDMSSRPPAAVRMDGMVDSRVWAAASAPPDALSVITAGESAAGLMERYVSTDRGYGSTSNDGYPSSSSDGGYYSSSVQSTPAEPIVSTVDFSILAGDVGFSRPASPNAPWLSHGMSVEPAVARQEVIPQPREPVVLNHQAELTKWPPPPPNYGEVSTPEYDSPEPASVPPPPPPQAPEPPPPAAAPAPRRKATPAAPRAKRKPQQPKPKKLPPKEAAACPYCAAAVIIDSNTAADMVAAPGRFALYRPRIATRKDNRLAAWYTKYGYDGPGYCKSCSEKFNSHLLRQNAQVARASCSRAVPCKPCTGILANFSCEPSELYHKFDSRHQEQKAAAAVKRQALKREQMHDADTNSDDAGGAGGTLSESLLWASKPGGAAAPKKKSRKAAAALAALATIAAMYGFVNSSFQSDSGKDGPSAAPSSPLDQAGWICGDDAMTIYNRTWMDITAYRAAHGYLGPGLSGNQAEIPYVKTPGTMGFDCSSVELGTTFPCDVDECAPSGKVSVGSRTCRCDGCFQPGRCAGWTLKGHSVAANEGGRECTLGGGVKKEHYQWQLPSRMPCSDCEAFGLLEESHVTCGTGSIRADNFLADSEPPLQPLQLPTLPEALETCVMETAGAWPQPVGGIAQIVNTGFRGNMREGVIWEGAGGGHHMAHPDHPRDLWLYSLNTPTELLPPGFDETAGALEPDASAGTDYATTDHVDAHQIWKYETLTRSWRPQPSVLANQPGGRVGAGRWADETGSLFVWSGTRTDASYHETHPRCPQMANPDILPSICASDDLWRFDTTAGEWSLISAGAPTASESEAERIREDFGEVSGGGFTGGNTGAPVASRSGRRRGSVQRCGSTRLRMRTVSMSFGCSEACRSQKLLIGGVTRSLIRRVDLSRMAHLSCGSIRTATSSSRRRTSRTGGRWG